MSCFRFGEKNMKDSMKEILAYLQVFRVLCDRVVYSCFEHIVLALFHFFLEAFGTGVSVLVLLVPVGVVSSLLSRFLR